MPWEQIVALVTAILAFLPTIYAWRKELAKEIARREQLMACLGSKNVKCYGLCTCPRCKEQIRILGSRLLEGIYIETGQDCPSYDSSLLGGWPPGTHSTPVWVFPDGFTEGVIYSYYDLSQKTGCPY